MWIWGFIWGFGGCLFKSFFFSENTKIPDNFSPARADRIESTWKNPVRFEFQTAVLHTERNVSVWGIDSFSIYALWNLVCTHHSLKIKVFSKWELCVLLNRSSNTLTSRNAAGRNRYFPLSKGMNCRSVGGKQCVHVCVCISKQITKTIRNHYKSFNYVKQEEKDQIKSRNTVYLVETTDEEA